jgi:uncharacterized protein (DUF433 family)
MTYRGTVRNGVVVFDGDQPRPPEGTVVWVDPMVETPGASRGVYKHPRVSGGDACVGDSRVSVWSLVRFRQLGRTDEQLLRDFPSLTPEDLAAAWAYAAAHRDEIEQALLEQERA